MKVLIATEKPFAKKAVDGIKSILSSAKYEIVLLESYKEKSQLLEAIADVDAVIIRSDKITADVLEAAKNLKIVVRAGAGYDNVDLECAKSKNVVVMNTPGQNSNAVAELTIAMMIFMSRNQFTPGSGSEIMNKTLGLHAYGNIGTLVGRKAKAMGMEVIAYDPYISDAIFKNEGVCRVDSVEELFEKSNFLSLHIPATEQTKKSIGYKLITSMPEGATIINTARKEIIDEQELSQAMAERGDIKYITDIASSEHGSLVEAYGKRVFATSKKIGAETEEANINAGLASASQIVNFFETGNVQFQVNK